MSGTAIERQSSPSGRPPRLASIPLAFVSVDYSRLTWFAIFPVYVVLGRTFGRDVKEVSAVFAPEPTAQLFHAGGMERKTCAIAWPPC